MEFMLVLKSYKPDHAIQSIAVQGFARNHSATSRPRMPTCVHRLSFGLAPYGGADRCVFDADDCGRALDSGAC